MTDDVRVLRVPVLIGGPGDGMPVVDSGPHRAAGATGDLCLYREREWYVAGADVALRFESPDGLPDGEAFALVWAWLLRTALEGKARG